MNNELKYGIAGLFMAVIVLTSVKFIFNLTGSSSKQSESAGFSPIPEIVIGEKGKRLFLENCKACHSLGNHNFLAGINERVPNRSLLRDFIRNSQEVIRSGDPYFTKMWNYTIKLPCPLFQTFLTMR